LDNFDKVYSIVLLGAACIGLYFLYQKMKFQTRDKVIIIGLFVAQIIFSFCSYIAGLDKTENINFLKAVLAVYTPFILPVMILIIQDNQSTITDNAMHNVVNCGFEALNKRLDTMEDYQKTLIKENEMLKKENASLNSLVDSAPKNTVEVRFSLNFNKKN